MVKKEEGMAKRRGVVADEVSQEREEREESERVKEWGGHETERRCMFGSEVWEMGRMS